MPANGSGGQNGGGGGISQGYWSGGGEGDRQWIPATVGGRSVGQYTPPAAPAPPPPKFGEAGYVAKPGEKGWVRKAQNVQRANIDRGSQYRASAAGADYLQTRNASNPQPQGSTGAGAVGYDFTPSNERLY